MHTYKANNGTLFHFNSDFSGEVVIDFGSRIVIPAKDILEFVAHEYVLPKKIERLETSSIEKILE